jgi:hypothetical protein
LNNEAVTSAAKFYFLRCIVPKIVQFDNLSALALEKSHFGKMQQEFTNRIRLPVPLVANKKKNI